MIVGKDHDLEKDTRVHTQNSRVLDAVIEVLDKDNNVLEAIEGIVTGGNMSISGESLIRRTGSIEVVMMDKVLPRKNNLFWISNKIRVYIGIKDNSSFGDYATYCIGTFYLSSASSTINATERKVSVTLDDYMMRWEDTPLEEKLVIEADTPLNIAVIETMKNFGELNVDVQITDVLVPYKLEYEAGESVMSIIQALRDLYMDYEAFYTSDGTFVFRKVNMQLEDSQVVQWRFEGTKDLILSYQKDYDFRKVKNKVIVYGKVNDDGSFNIGTKEITDESHHFHKNEIGVKPSIINEASYYTNQQCEARAVYELYLNSNMKESYNLSTLPIYFLDANDIIEVYNEDLAEFEKVKVDSISYDLTTDAEMSISASKLYYNSFIYESIDLEKYREMSEIILEKIRNKGWLSLAEQRVEQYFGLKGKGGADVTIRFTDSGKGGVTAYVTAYPTNRSQNITIDLADFGGATGDSGDNGTGKGDYSDRILGHEVLHLAMNDSFTASKTATIPEWYKEGMGELLHGADERLKNVIYLDGVISPSKVSMVTARAIRLLNGDAFKSVTDDYVAGYIATKIMSNKLREVNKTFIQFHDHIKTYNGEGNEAFTSAIDTFFGGMATLTSFLTLNGDSYIMSLDLQGQNEDELDTGSIAGKEHLGTGNLNAENIFDNSTAVEGVYLNNFNVKIEKP